MKQWKLEGEILSSKEIKDKWIKDLLKKYGCKSIVRFRDGSILLTSPAKVAKVLDRDERFKEIKRKGWDILIFVGAQADDKIHGAEAEKTYFDYLYNKHIRSAPEKTEDTQDYS